MRENVLKTLGQLLSTLATRASFFEALVPRVAPKELIIYIICSLGHIDDIITNIFQYINLLKKEGPQEWIFNEIKVIIKQFFNGNYLDNKSFKLGSVYTIPFSLHIGLAFR